MLGAMIAAAAVLTASPALAHAKLVSSNPVPNSSIAAPRVITLTFSEAVVPAFSTAELIMDGHKQMKVPVKLAVAKDGKTLVATPQGKVMPGAYHIDWTVTAADDGHKTQGEVPFKVR